ncbi:OmpA family protein [Brachyspira pilosicoli]|uniref:OmpA family outer membrane protein n=2 Tax=Brachyspira pilosicoli TaxID=52584 RepID=K0JLG1_BRAPL|nr:OmpA family protein [Brachyspira pilosicoli]PLV58473.1 membrane protein [Brachyspira pilosicoli SP16]WIH90449.1 OmpA family protein [Brachyspira pilosicoli]WIH92740.1 OmpA family protein [Brachyspira pilosicoli]WIH95029.1 OmpA family protein [Brachyspira pilosicoli]CCG57265.1 OmpA family outer membrane protein [Brachyspira pilosicoli WesB]
MSKIKFILILTIFIFNISYTQTISHKFFWNLKVGERIESVKTADVEYYENGLLKKTYKERNIVDLTVIAIAPKGGYRVSGVFKIFRLYDGNSVFHLEEEYSSDFIIHTNGKFEVPYNYFMPNVRHIPTFPDKEISLTHSWNSEAMEIVKVNNAPNLAMALSADYLFANIETNENNDPLAVIQYHIMTDKDLLQAGLSRNGYPERIYGFNYGTFLWDMNKNIPVSQTERYQILFGYGKNLSYLSLQYKMNIISTYKIYSTITEEENEINRKKLEDNLNDDVVVDTVPEGLVIRLGEILFDTDSYTLKEDAKDTVDNIINAIKQTYPDREIIVEGHTDNTGEANYNQALSEKRAKTVADYILPKLEHDKLSYRGFGDKEPIASNDNPDGRQKNRRVDIIIKLR